MFMWRAADFFDRSPQVEAKPERSSGFERKHGQLETNLMICRPGGGPHGVSVVVSAFRPVPVPVWNLFDHEACS
eukprot:scaffold81482_cov39-Tisochrysis_lutea.AAC.1